MKQKLFAVHIAGIIYLDMTQILRQLNHLTIFFYKTKIGGEKGTFSFFEVDSVYNDDYNYKFLKDALIKTINKFKLEKIRQRKAELCKDF